MNRKYIKDPTDSLIYHLAYNKAFQRELRKAIKNMPWATLSTQLCPKNDLATLPERIDEEADLMIEIIGDWANC